ncbi:uncharacterized protein LOC112593231 [Melanaphis sacchari]|uniref:uncharacterized protein LOC112593231 n=1 Tax=Melanaphis sacchari TaxID=742174 RepID=UPI000DC15224|nr:uncharacterized protein LOC112593231 [Melanaphis sacchari]
MDGCKVKCTLLCGSSATYSQTILFESAVYWAEFGYRVVYIQISQMTSLPIPLDGAKPPSVHALNRITFLTLSQWEDLVKYTCSIHENSPNVPHVILVSDLNNYYMHEDSDRTTRLAHMLCACLCDAISYCSKVHNSTTYLTVSTQDTTLETDKLSAMYFPSNTWVSSVVDDQILFCKKQLYSHQQHSCRIKFIEVNNKLRCDSVKELYM